MGEYKIGIGEHKVGFTPDILSCIGLGSCVGIILHDPRSQVGGLAHIMLPYSREVRNNSAASIKAAKFADTAIPIILEEMMAAEAQRNRIVAKIVGGSCMFSSNGSTESLFDIGKRNVEAVKDILKEERIRILAEDTGGRKGRSVDFHTHTGKVVVRSKADVIEL